MFRYRLGRRELISCGRDGRTAFRDTLPYDRRGGSDRARVNERHLRIKFDTDYLPEKRLIRSASYRLIPGEAIEVQEQGRWVRCRIERRVSGVFWITRETYSEVPRRDDVD